MEIALFLPILMAKMMQQYGDETLRNSCSSLSLHFYSFVIHPTTSNSKHSYPILFSSHLSRVAPHFSTPLPIPRVKRWLSQGIFVKDWMMRVKQCPRSLWLSEATSASDLTPMWGSRRSSRWWVGMLCFFVRCLFVCCFGSGFDIRETSKKSFSSFRYCTSSVLKFIGFWKVLSDMGVSKNRGTPVPPNHPF